jgi:hypothetical protein
VYFGRFANEPVFISSEVPSVLPGEQDFLNRHDHPQLNPYLFTIQYLFLYPNLTLCNVSSCHDVENLLNIMFTEGAYSFNLTLLVKNICRGCMIFRIPLKCDLFPKLHGTKPTICAVKTRF